MRKYPEFESFNRLIDLCNRDAHCYQDDGNTNHIFYIEQGFYSSFEQFKILYPSKVEEFLTVLHQKRSKNPITVFTLNEEAPYVVKDGAIFVTLEDICNLIKVDVSKKSTGSNYGD